MRKIVSNIVSFVSVFALVFSMTVSHSLLAFLIPQANAGTFSPAKLTINNSQSGAAGVTYSFNFTASVTTSVKQLTILFCNAASGACVAPTGLVNTGAAIASDNIAGTGRTNTFSGNGTLTTVVTTPAAQSTQAINITYTGITNPTTANTTYYARITTYSDTGTTVIDTATVAFAVLDATSIAVSASVDPTFTFSIAGIAGTGSNTVNSSTLTNGVTTTATTIPFATLSAATAKRAAHDITIITNASNGYMVTASSAATAQSGFPPLISGSTNNIDTFSGTNTTPSVWSSPAGTGANVNTGYFGYTTEDTTLCTGTAGRFSSNKWAGPTTTGFEVACSTTAVTSETTRIGYQIEVNAIQPPGTYSGTIILIATPTY